MMYIAVMQEAAAVTLQYEYTYLSMWKLRPKFQALALLHWWETMLIHVLTRVEVIQQFLKSSEKE